MIRSKATYVLIYLMVFQIIYLGTLYYIQTIEFAIFWSPFAIGFIVIVFGILYVVARWKKGFPLLVPIVLNSVSIAFLANAYLMKLDQVISYTNLFIIFCISFAFYIIYITLLYNRWILKHAGWILFFISTISILCLIALWITENPAIYSNLLFSMIITIVMIIVAISSDDNKADLDRNLSVISFISIIILVIVLSLLLESGDFFEGIVPGTFGKNPNRNAPQNIKL